MYQMDHDLVLRTLCEDNMKPEDRKKEWQNLPFPKPDWETFKRMLPLFNFDTLEVHRKWIAKTNKKISMYT